MPDGTRAILMQLAKTGLCAGTLGIVLYAVLAFIAKLPGAQWMISLFVAVPMALLIGHAAVQALRTGRFASMRGTITRAGQPLAFWGLTATFLLSSLLLCALAIWSAGQLFSLM